MTFHRPLLAVLLLLVVSANAAPASASASVVPTGHPQAGCPSDPSPLACPSGQTSYYVPQNSEQCAHYICSISSGNGGSDGGGSSSSSKQSVVLPAVLGSVLSAIAIGFGAFYYIVRRKRAGRADDAQHQDAKYMSSYNNLGDDGFGANPRSPGAYSSTYSVSKWRDAAFPAPGSPRSHSSIPIIFSQENSAEFAHGARETKLYNGAHEAAFRETRLYPATAPTDDARKWAAPNVVNVKQKPQLVVLDNSLSSVLSAGELEIDTANARGLRSASSDTKTYSSTTSNTSESALPSCQPASLTCDEGQMLVLSVSGSSCSWSCEKDPHYQTPTNNKRPVIGGSLGAMVFVLFVLLGVLLFTQLKKRRRERAMYLKDTADLASELSSAPLIQPLSPGSPSDLDGLDASHPQVFAWRSIGDRKAHPGFFATPAMPSPGEAGTELSMDIINRPPESDPSLAASNGSTPYRQEKTADAYPLLSYFSGRPDTVSTPIPFPPISQAKLARLQRTPTQPDLDLEPPESHLMRSYAAARSSGDAAIAAAHESAIATLPATAFDPFNAVPSIRSSPYSEEARSLVSRRASDRTGKSLADDISHV
ncbi:hypothetical protein GGI21_000498 [Coemansia aciculifera]|nr:hypothetical protein GGI21_000498 [Coemansia aciculifera]